MGRRIDSNPFSTCVFRDTIYMMMKKNWVLSNLTESTGALSSCDTFQQFAAALTDEAVTMSHSDAGCFYRFGSEDGDLEAYYQRAAMQLPVRFPVRSETVSFLEEWPEMIVLSDRKPSPFVEILLEDRMRSGIAMPLCGPCRDSGGTYGTSPNMNYMNPFRWFGILILNSKQPAYYRGARYLSLESLGMLACGMVCRDWMPEAYQRKSSPVA